MGRGATTKLVYRVTPSRLFPEVSSDRGLIATEDGTRRMLVDRMRVLVRPDGSIERAVEIMPLGNVSSVALPSRLGGGFLFHVNQGRGTEMWRAATWLDKLSPLTRMSDVVTDIVPGFDRLYVRLSSGNRVVAIDAKDGKLMGLGPLPSAASYGLLAFADGWRAVVDTDLRGPLTTFDAGATWRSVGVSERVLAVGVVDGNPSVMVPGGRYLIDPRGGVTFHSDAVDPRERPAASDDERRRSDDLAEMRRPNPLGKRPLRAAAEDGWPDSATTAVVARSGALARVSLTDGRVIALSDEAYPDHRSTCHAARLGLHEVGFLCGETDGATAVYAFEPPLAMRPVLRYEKARYVAASGNGALVIRGRCADDAPTPRAPPSLDSSLSSAAPVGDEAEGHWYCVRTPQGDMREVRIKGFDLGIERVVGLGDGRIAVVVPPRGGSAGALSIITGSRTVSVPLELPADAHGRDLKRGLWLDGFEERRPGVLGGWVEAGGPYVGIEITLDGKVKAGAPRDDASGAVFGGRFAVALLEGGHALETSDGGMTWAPFDLPDRDEEARAAPSRGCGPVGCALPGWVRVGWGDPEDATDLKEAAAPTAPVPPIRMPPTMHFDCSVTSTTTPPLPDRHVAPPPAPVYTRHGYVITPTPAAPRAHGPSHDTAWAPFRNGEPPALAADDYGVDNGPGPNDAITLHAYAWGKAGADWTRGGRWLVRFDDRFDATAGGGVRASAVTASLWSQQTDAVEGIGTNAYSGTVWRGFLDPSGRALLGSACNRQGCAVYSIADGQPILPLRTASGVPLPRPYDNAAVRVGETWFLLTGTPSYDGIALWRAELGAVKPVATYHRTTRGYSSYALPRLVRRALGTGIGILSEGPPEPGERSGSGSWFVLPIDPETGALGDAIALTRRDFSGVRLARCGPAQDGWVFDVGQSPDVNTSVELDNARSRFEGVEMRVRLDPGRGCVEGLAARTDAFLALPLGNPVGVPQAPPGASLGSPAKPLTAPPGRRSGGGALDEGTVPMAATEKQSGRRWGLVCKMRP